MRSRSLARRLPRWLRRLLLRFEAAIEDSVASFAASLPEGTRVLDAGAGECTYAGWFRRQHYVGVDMAVGDPGWDYSRLDAIADLEALPFPDGCFGACLNIVTLEHVRDPLRVLRELARILAPGGRLLLVAPQEWEVHQAPRDYYRFTRYGLGYLLEQAGLQVVSLRAAGGLFCVLARRLLNALQLLPLPLWLLAVWVVLPASLLASLLDGLDRERNFTLGYICIAARSCV